MAELVVVSPLRIEAAAVAGVVERCGAGPRRATAAAERLAGRLAPGTAVALAGVAGGLDPNLSPGEVVVADELRSTDGSVGRRLAGAELLAAELRRAGLVARVGPLLSSPTFVGNGRRAELAAGGALAVDMESAFWAAAVGDRPVAVVRTVADTAGAGPAAGGLRAIRSLLRVRPALDRWAAAVGDREVVLASPRSFCAGVERAIEIVERALERFGAPVYVRRQIVHNRHVVERLEALGARFVTELDEVPDDATVVLAAHGVAPAVRQAAEARGDLRVIDATCPLVAKVHHEARRFAAQGYQIALVGHTDHEEVEGTVGEAPGAMRVVERADDVDRLAFDPDAPVAYLTQTTLATDETAEVVEALRRRFPHLVGPSATDICYATSNRQEAVRAVARRADLVLVVGSANSSNTARLVEVARREGARAELVEDASDLRLDWLAGAATIGLSAGASAPDALVAGVVDALGQLGTVTVSEVRTTEEHTKFTLPPQVR